MKLVTGSQEQSLQVACAFWCRCVHSENSSNLATFRGGENDVWEEAGHVCCIATTVTLVRSRRSQTSGVLRKKFCPRFFFRNEL